MVAIEKQKCNAQDDAPNARVIYTSSIVSRRFANVMQDAIDQDRTVEQTQQLPMSSRRPHLLPAIMVLSSSAVNIYCHRWVLFQGDPKRDGRTQ